MVFKPAATKLVSTSSGSETKDSKNLTPDPDILAQEIVEDVEAALEQFREIAVDLGSEEVKAEKS